MTQGDGPARPALTRSTRDPETLRPRLEAWLAGQLDARDTPVVTDLETPAASGMSSETLLFRARWQAADGSRSGAFVARLAPDPGDEPVFPAYDLAAQFRLLRLVERSGEVPVPAARWLELDPAHLGTPFFVMDRVDGRVPPDVMPYNMGSWLSEAPPADQAHLQQATVAAIAGLHRIDPSAADFLAFDLPGESPLRRHVENQRRYYRWARAERRHPVIERAFEWLGSHWPEREGAPVISWGDSRIGNVIYAGLEPAALLDWEMAALGPRELDLGWLIFIHLFFEDIAHRAGLPGMPDFLRADDVAGAYAECSGHEPARLDWFLTYAALRHAIVMTRVHARSVRFGEASWPEDVDAVIPHREVLERMLRGAGVG